MAGLDRIRNAGNLRENIEELFPSVYAFTLTINYDRNQNFEFESVYAINYYRNPNFEFESVYFVFNTRENFSDTMYMYIHACITI